MCDIGVQDFLDDMENLLRVTIDYFDYSQPAVQDRFTWGAIHFADYLQQTLIFNSARASSVWSV